MAEWIKVDNEETPQIWTKVLAVNKIGDMEVCFVCRIGSDEYPSWFTYQTRQSFEPTHWMQLPKWPDYKDD